MNHLIKVHEQLVTVQPADLNPHADSPIHVAHHVAWLCHAPAFLDATKEEARRSAMADEEQLDLIWGVEAIAAFINRTPRQTYHMLSKGFMPGRTVGGRWVVDRRDLISFFRQNAS
jgi:hypothetical protein